MQLSYHIFDSLAGLRLKGTLAAILLEVKDRRKELVIINIKDYLSPPLVTTVVLGSVFFPELSYLSQRDGMKGTV